MSKREQVMEYIRAHGESWRWSGWSVWRAAADCDCSINTVYTAMRSLKQMGAMADNGSYTGRPFITPEEIAAAFTDPNGIGFILTDARYDALCKRFFCDRRTLWLSIEWAWQSGYLEERQGGSYGLMFIGKAAA